MYAYNSVPKMIIEGFKNDPNKYWVAELKQEKEDDFINLTHLNPVLKKFNLPKLDGSKI